MEKENDEHDCGNFETDCVECSHECFTCIDRGIENRLVKFCKNCHRDHHVN